MAWVIGGKHFGQYTYEHWFDDEYGDENKNVKTDEQNGTLNGEPKENFDSENTNDLDDSTVPHKPPRQP